MGAVDAASWRFMMEVDADEYEGLLADTGGSQLQPSDRERCVEVICTTRWYPALSLLVVVACLVVAACVLAQPPPVLLLSARYIRCDLLPSSSTADIEAGQCQQYESGGSEEAQRQYWQAEASAYLAGRDSAYFSLFDFRYAPAPVQVNGLSLGGRLVVLHENCAPHAWSDELSPLSAEWRVAAALERRFGPTWLELRVQGAELLVQPLDFVHPTDYRQHHRDILASGSQRIAAMALPQYRTFTAHQSGHELYSVVSPSNKSDGGSVPARAYGNDVCLYETTYQASIAGLYDVRLYLEGVDYEHLSNEGRRAAWRRVQLAPMWNVSNLNLSANTQLAVLRPQHVQFANSTITLPALDTAQSEQSADVRSTGLLLLEADCGVVVPLLPRGSRSGRWVRRSHSAAQHKLVWWKRATMLRQYIAPHYGHCQVANLSHYEYVPYSFSRAGMSLPSGSADRSVSGWPRPLQPPATPSAFSFAHAECCLSGRRLAFLGDSQTRVLIGRFASVLSGEDVKLPSSALRRPTTTTARRARGASSRGSV